MSSRDLERSPIPAKQRYIALTDEEDDQVRILAIRLKVRPSKLMGDAVRQLLTETKGKGEK